MNGTHPPPKFPEKAQLRQIWESKLPIVYHGTFDKAAEMIQKIGLSINKRAWGDHLQKLNELVVCSGCEDGLNVFYAPGTRIPGVGFYITYDFNEAVEYAWSSPESWSCSLVGHDFRKVSAEKAWRKGIRQLCTKLTYGFFKGKNREQYEVMLGNEIWPFESDRNALISAVCKLSLLGPDEIATALSTYDNLFDFFKDTKSVVLHIDLRKIVDLIDFPLLSDFSTFYSYIEWRFRVGEEPFDFERVQKDIIGGDKCLSHGAPPEAITKCNYLQR